MTKVARLPLVCRFTFIFTLCEYLSMNGIITQYCFLKQVKKLYMHQFYFYTSNFNFVDITFSLLLHFLWLPEEYLIFVLKESYHA